jgi:hypothetical protein
MKLPLLTKASRNDRARGDSTIQVIGTFTFHGTPHDLSVSRQIYTDRTTCTAKTHLTVPYV